MTRAARIWIGVAACYGHSAAHHVCHDTKDYCASASQVDAGFAGVMAALVWPLYWSWELQA